MTTTSASSPSVEAAAKTAVPSHKPTKNEKKRLKQKEKKLQSKNKGDGDDDEKKHRMNVGSNDSEVGGDDDGFEIEYVSVNPLSTIQDPTLLEQFKTIFEKFADLNERSGSSTTTTILTADATAAKAEAASSSSDAVAQKDSSKSESNTEKPQKLSKKKKKLLSRLSVPELKQLVSRPDVVEAHDVTSLDPRLLVYLKSYRNTVQVPRHWSAKRKYLQGKRGIEKPPFQLPEFIAETGIAKIRDAVLEQENQKKAKQKNRDRLQPKMGKIDIDYQVLHDAFFKYQTKPKLTRHGELYYEGKEFEVNLKEKTPGVLSAELKLALGINDSVPPPWLMNMQRFGPPPSYPNLRIPGLNAPIPAGCQFGYGVGQWGKPPVDEYGRPIYGDVFGYTNIDVDAEYDNVDKTTRWGALQVSELQEEEEEEEEEDDDEDAPVVVEKPTYGKDGFRSSGLETPNTMDGMNSVTGLDTPGVIDLRKRASGLETPESVYGGGGGVVRELYQVIQEKIVTGAANASGQLFGSDRTYVLPGGKYDQLNGIDEGEAGAGQDGGEEDGEDNKGKKKRRLDSNNAAKRYKDFKF